MNIKKVKKEAIFAFGKKFWKENKESIIKAIDNIKLSVGDEFDFDGHSYVVKHIYITHEGILEAAYFGIESINGKEYEICKRQSSLEKAGSI